MERFAEAMVILGSGYTRRRELADTSHQTIVSERSSPPSHSQETLAPHMVTRRRSEKSPETYANALRLLPAKWALALIVLAILYVLIQPVLNARLGWSLPSVPELLGQSDAPNRTTPSRPDKSRANNTGTSTRQETGPSSKENKSSKVKDPSIELKYGFLESLGGERYRSPAGLMYGPGSEEGHRLAHLERHLRDAPKRVGSHGVFEGDMKAFLEAIDETYKRARGHAKGSRSRREENEMVYEALFEKPIGYLGGMQGGERNNPKLLRMRVVVRDGNVITAFPVP